MKKHLSLLLSSVLMLSLCACGNVNDSQKNDVNQDSLNEVIIEEIETEIEQKDVVSKEVIENENVEKNVEKEEIVDVDNNEILVKDEIIEEIEPEVVESEITSLKYEDIVINIPQNIMKLITVKDGTESTNPHIVNLFDIYETAAIAAGQKMHPGEDWGDGWLFGISVADEIGFEELLGMDIPGYSVIAQNDDKYYLYTTPTDVRLMREDNNYQSGIEEWSMLCEWANSMKENIIADNDLLPVSLFTSDFTYDSEHKYFEYKDGFSHNVIVMSQPVQQGENGIWCVERVEEYYNDNMTYARLIFPISLGIEKSSHQYYVELQEAVDNRTSLSALDYKKVLEEFLNSDAWYYENVNSKDLTEIFR